MTSGQSGNVCTSLLHKYITVFITKNVYNKRHYTMHLRNIVIKHFFKDAFCLLIIVLCVWVFYLHTCFCTCIPGAPRGQKKGLEPLLLELQTALKPVCGY